MIRCAEKLTPKRRSLPVPKDRIALITTTLTAPSGENDVRLNLACEMAKAARNAGHDVLVAEKHHSDNPTAVQKLEKHGAIVFPQLGGTPGADRRFLFKQAASLSDVCAILWSEEKPYMGEGQVIDAMIERMRSRGAAALVPGRSEKSWATWPWLQQMTEPIANRLYNELFGSSEDGVRDVMHGPLFVALDAVEHVLQFDPTAFGLADILVQQYVSIDMLSKGLKVAALNFDCSYPADQRAEEEGPKLEEMFNRRMSQLNQIVKGHFVLQQALFAEKAK